jgi:hypothetical protein
MAYPPPPPAPIIPWNFGGPTVKDAKTVLTFDNFDLGDDFVGNSVKAPPPLVLFPETLAFDDYPTPGSVRQASGSTTSNEAGFFDDLQVFVSDAFDFGLGVFKDYTSAELTGELAEAQLEIAKADAGARIAEARNPKVTVTGSGLNTGLKIGDIQVPGYVLALGAVGAGLIVWSAVR